MPRRTGLPRGVTRPGIDGDGASMLAWMLLGGEFQALRILRIRLQQIDLPLLEGSYNGSNENRVAVFDSTVVAVETDAGIAG